MRRTYRSKKETTGALHHTDVIQALDEKSSAFDAFYIQNIKQTKRELSCIGPSSNYAGAANKVRKRKYVKRIAKEPETRRNSSSHSVFLTPDKSLRVNKGQDLFDQLLNLSSPQPTESHKNSRNNLERNLPRQQSKTYTRRKLAKIKKFNYCSSSDSIESDKENSNEDFGTQNVTDLHGYELIIEKERKPSPKYLDESINKIVNNLSALNGPNLHKSTSIGLAKKSFDNARHRLTTNIQSPSNSPLCSTPFKEKYRSQSIYNFSPISLAKNDASAEYLAIVEEKGNDSKLIVEKCENQSILNFEENLPSPVIHLSRDKSVKSEVSKTSNASLETHRSHVTNVSDFKNDKSDKIIGASIIEISDFQTTEPEPFLGFTNTQLHDSLEEIHKSTNEDRGSNENKSKEDIFSILENTSFNESNVDNHSLRDTEEVDNECESSYGSCNSEQSFNNDFIEAIKVPVIKIERLNNSVIEKYLSKLANSESDDDTDSEVLDALDSDEFASFEDSQHSTHNSNKSSDESGHEMLSDEKDLNDTSEENSITSDNNDLNENNEKEGYLSFVTTRRRNEIGNDSLIFDFNNSYGSASSTNCDKTVISNNVDETKIQTSLSPYMEGTKTDYNNPVFSVCAQDKEFLNEEFTNENREGTELKELDIKNDPRTSKITIRRSSKIAKDRNLDIGNSITDEVKPAIVLQPGKKWERSLSIYRRMTMMTDNFDQSVLDDEEFNNKGRKYRQSVISTMELQDKGSLHNESINSRRSTFVSKPCRSTIRIIREPNSSRLSLCTTSAISDDLRGFLNEDCDETIVELSKLSIADSEHEVTVVENFHDTSSRVSTARDYVLRRCGQNDVILFDECYPEAVLKNCRKIGEGVYGEVFLWRAGDGRARVMKIVPIAGTTKVNGERQKDFHEIISEIVIAMELSALRAPIDEIQHEFDEGKDVDPLDLHSVANATDVFNKVLAVRCVSGAYPSRLLDLWELYDECNGSENDNPAILPVDQQYIVLELANAGQDLESYEFNSAEQAHALFLQVAFGLAVAEEAFQFEHRDLHWGNVLIAPSDQKFATFVLRGRPHRVPRCGVAATVIDYSLSRLSLPLAGDAAALYNDLAADDGLFDAVGDYQFQVYRLMREKLGNDWKNFEPYTNILWLHYTVDKMITALRYKRTNTKIHKHYIAKLKGIKNRLLDYGSAAQFVLTDNEL